MKFTPYPPPPAPPPASHKRSLFSWGDPDPDVALSPQIRAELLDMLAKRIAGRLRDRLEQQVDTEPGLRAALRAVDPAWRQLHGDDSTETRVAPEGTSLLDVFAKQQGQLLILGAPGAGKTTLLLKLAHELISCAQRDPAAPVPVVVDLSSWAQSRAPLHEWLAGALTEVLRDTAGIAPRLAQLLIARQQLLPLLDGLDEVAAEQRGACIKAINDAIAGQALPRLVVCSRSAEYEAAGARLAPGGAVMLEPLDRDQVAAVLAANLATAGLARALRDNSLPAELMRSPLLLNIALIAYAGKAVPAARTTSVAEWQASLCAAYVRRMLQQRPLSGRYRPAQALRWLAWLAGKMRRDNLTMFLVERMQPRWLAQLWPYRVLQGLILTLGTGLAGGLASGLAVGLVFGPGAGLVFGWVFGICSGPLFGPGYRSIGAIHPTADLSWSWRTALRSAWKDPLGLFGTLVLGLGGGLILGLGLVVFSAVFSGLAALLGISAAVPGPDVWLISGLSWGLTIGLGLGLGLALNEGFQKGFVVNDLTKTAHPNQAIRDTLRHGLARLLGAGLIFGAGLGLGLGPGGALGALLVFGLGLGLVLGMMTSGLGDYISHYILRFCLVLEGALPWRYVDYLETMRDLRFLERDGGIYRFRHILLRDYFAALTPEQIAELAKDDG